MGAPDTIKLDQYLKHVGAAGTGGQAKVLVQSGEVLVNGEPETRRGRQLREGDTVQLKGQDPVYTVGPVSRPS